MSVALLAPHGAFSFSQKIFLLKKNENQMVFKSFIIFIAPSIYIYVLQIVSIPFKVWYSEQKKKKKTNLDVLSLLAFPLPPLFQTLYFYKGNLSLHYHSEKPYHTIKSY